MKINNVKIKELYTKLAETTQKIGLQLNISLLVYTVIICVITVNLDRSYIAWKIEKAANKAFEQMDSVFENKDVKKDKKKKNKFFAPKPQIIASGSTINTKTIEVDIQKASFINKLVPPHIKEWSYYTYYEAKDKNNMLIDIVVNVKNLNTSEISTENVLQDIKAIYDSKYEYSGFYVVEQVDGGDFDSTSTIKPLQTRKVHYLIEVPKFSKSDNAPMEVIFDIDNKTYVLSLKNQKENNVQQVIPPKNTTQENKKEKVNNVVSPKELPKTNNQTKTIKTNSTNNIKNKKTNVEPVKNNTESAEEMLFN